MRELLKLQSGDPFSNGKLARGKLTIAIGDGYWT
jgi:hypothetical protein